MQITKKLIFIKRFCNLLKPNSNKNSISSIFYIDLNHNSKKYFFFIVGDNLNTFETCARLFLKLPLGHVSHL